MITKTSALKLLDFQDAQLDDGNILDMIKHPCDLPPSPPLLHRQTMQQANANQEYVDILRQFNCIHLRAEQITLEEFVDALKTIHTVQNEEFEYVIENWVPSSSPHKGLEIYHENYQYYSGLRLQGLYEDKNGVIKTNLWGKLSENLQNKLFKTGPVSSF